MGFNEAAGYGAVALTALATGFIAANHGLRPEPFYLGRRLRRRSASASPPCSCARPTATPSTKPRATRPARRDLHGELSTGEIFALTSFREKALSSCSQAGMVNNLNDGLAWGLFPLYFAAAGLSVRRIGVLAALYPAVWGLGQLVTGGLSDRIGRKPLIVGGMLTQAVAIALIARHDRVLDLGRRRHAPRRGHRHGLPDAPRRDRRRRPPLLAGPVRRRLPALARRRLRRRRPPRRRSSPTSSASPPPSGPSPPSPRSPGSS